MTVEPQKSSASPYKRHPILSIFCGSFNGLFQENWVRCFVVLGMLLPVFGYISQDVHFAVPPFKLFVDYQYGLHRYLALFLGLSCLHSLWLMEKESGTTSILKAAGITPIEQLIGKHLSLFVIVLTFQLLLVIYSYLLSLPWPLEAHLTLSQDEHQLVTWPYLLASGWLNTLLVCTTLFAIRFFWILLDQEILGYLAGLTWMIAGIGKSIWLSYFLYSENMIDAFRLIGKSLSFMIPNLYAFDVWFVMEQLQTFDLMTHTLQVTSIAGLWIALFHFASWVVQTIKQN